MILTRDGCHLCAEALALAEAICSDAGASLLALDVDADADLKARYTDHVPVTFVDGRQLSIWFLDADALRAALAVQLS